MKFKKIKRLASYCGKNMLTISKELIKIKKREEAKAEKVFQFEWEVQFLVEKKDLTKKWITYYVFANGIRIAFEKAWYGFLCDLNRGTNTDEIFDIKIKKLEGVILK